MTGKHSGHCTVRENGPTLASTDVTVAEVLKRAGYVNALFGKRVNFEANQGGGVSFAERKANGDLATIQLRIHAFPRTQASTYITARWIRTCATSMTVCST